ncbi:MAG: hypothetical protein BGN88_01290 [Clostridiales bacterium 43-6]|nr:MAG: hypothetical protein BGN88_01290 [Clostridiales bacterium 43-6]
MKKQKVFFLFPWLMVATWAVVIFMFSAETGAQSSQLSEGITTRIIPFFFALLGKSQDTSSMNAAVLVMHGYLREFAHMLEYSVLGLLTYHAVIRTTSFASIRISGSFLLCFLYALSDEIHQLFVPERTFQLIDLCMDSIGILLGIFLCRLIAIKIDKQKAKRSGVLHP